MLEVGSTERGTRRRVTVSAKTQAAVKVKLREKARAIEEAGDSGVSSRTTVKAWAEQWLPIVERELRPASYNATRSAVRQWIVPTIGHRRLDQLRRLGVFAEGLDGDARQQPRAGRDIPRRFLGRLGILVRRQETHALTLHRNGYWRVISRG